MQADAPRPFADLGAVRQGVVNAVQTVLLHGDQVARTELGARRAGVEQGGRGVDEIFLAHQIVGLFDRGHVAAVDADGDAEPHMLRALHDDAGKLKQVSALQGLEPEIIKEIVAVVIDHRFERFAVFLDMRPCLFRQEGARLAGRIHEIEELFHDCVKRTARVLVVVRDDDAGGEDPVVGVLGAQGGALLGGELVDFGRGNTVVQLVDDFHRQTGEIDINARLFADGFDAGIDLVEGDVFQGAIALGHAHFIRRWGVCCIHGSWFLVVIYNARFISKSFLQCCRMDYFYFYTNIVY